jgi:hypothetical protein
MHPTTLPQPPISTPAPARPRTPLPFRSPVALPSYHPNPTHDSSAPRRQLDGGVAPAADCPGGGRARPGSPAAELSWLVGRPDGGCPAERPAGIQRSGVVAVVGKARTPATASVAGPRPPGGVHSAVPSSGSGGPAVRCPAVVSSAASVQPVRCPAVRCPPVRRPAGCCPPPSVRTRPSRPPQAAAVGPGRGGRRPSPPERVEPRWAAASWSGSMDGRAGPDAGDAAEVAWSVGSVVDPGQVG